MNIFKRAWISIVRRKTNSIILMLIIFVLANVLLTTLTVTNSLKDTKEIVLKQFTPIVQIDRNYDYNTEENITIPTAEMADKLYANTKSIVKNYDYSTGVRLEAGQDLKLATVPMADDIRKQLEGHVVKDIKVSGTQLPQTSLVASDEAKMISGKGFSEEDIENGKAKVIVSKQFATDNALSVGSIFTLESVLYAMESGENNSYSAGDAYYHKEVEVEVAGIIEINEVEEFIKKQEVKENKSYEDISEKLILVNTIYAPNAFIRPINVETNTAFANKNPELAEDFLGDGEEHIYPKFVLNDFDDLDAFTKEANKIYNKDEFVVLSASYEYEIMAAPLSSMESLLDLVFKITVFASIVILSLVLCIFMYLRQKEMGIFLALGEQRYKIILQLLIETLLIAVIGGSLAILSSLFFSDLLASSTLQSLMSASSDAMNSGTIGLYSSGIDVDFISEQFQVGFSALTLGLFYLTMIFTIVVAQIVTAVYLLRLNPKKILM